MKKAGLFEYDEQREFVCWCLRNKREWYLDRTNNKFDPRFERARIFTQRSGANKAQAYYRKLYNDDSIACVRLLITLVEDNLR